MWENAGWMYTKKAQLEHFKQLNIYIKNAKVHDLIPLVSNSYLLCNKMLHSYYVNFVNGQSGPQLD